MARDPRKNSSFDSGMRGRQKPQVTNAHGGTFGQEDEGKAAGELKSKQGPDTQVGNPDGVGLSAYTSGMRGPEKPKQKSANGGVGNMGDANMGVEDGSTMGGENKQGANTIVGQPSGHPEAGKGPRKGVTDDHLRSAAKAAYGLGDTGSDNNTENSAMGEPGVGAEGILGEEDATHINIRIPKASLKKKQGGVHAA